MHVSRSGCCCVWRQLLVVALWLGSGLVASASDPVRLHPENPRYFQFRGEPVALVTATEHYGAVINRPFDYIAYLNDHAARGLNFTRTFLLFRELQTQYNPYSTCKPETADFITPYPLAVAGEVNLKKVVYDLNRWNPEYFSRLKSFLKAASDRGILVELTLFSNTYSNDVWVLNPLHSERNARQVPPVEWPAYITLRHPELVARQEAFARKIVQETADFDNVYYEICNEPAGGYAHPAQVTTAEVDRWLAHMAKVVREEMHRRGKVHLVVGAESLYAGKPNVAQKFADSYSGKVWDAIILHASDYDVWEGRTYKLGGFMNKDLRLREVRDFTLAVAGQKKPLISDEDNTASAYTTPSGWTVHRKRAWTTLLSGGHYNVIDFSVQVLRPRGLTPGIRTPLGHLAKFMQSVDFIHGQPGVSWISGVPPEVVVAGMAVPGKQYVAYLADAREVTEAHAGKTIRTSLTLALPRGNYSLTSYSPRTGESSRGVPVFSTGHLAVTVPPFEEDWVLQAVSLDRSSGSPAR